MNTEHADILAGFGITDAKVDPITVGNINLTFRVEAAGQLYTLQRLNPIFSPEIHHDIEAVTAHLERCGMSTPRLLRTSTGALWLTDARGMVWRMLTFVPGEIHSQGATPALCRSAGELLGRFHRCLSSLDHAFHAGRPGVHDTARHLAALRDALTRFTTHRASRQVEPVGRAILQAAAALQPLAGLPPRTVHGDPKLNNVVFSSSGDALCLIDLDTLSRMSLPVELGDAFRSWCNPFGEDHATCTFDLDCFRAGMEAYGAATCGFLTPAEVQTIPTAVETIALELSARFCADALAESYFGWNRQRFASACEHNLLRAQSQLTLAQSIGRQRGEMKRVVEQACATGVLSPT